MAYSVKKLKAKSAFKFGILISAHNWSTCFYYCTPNSFQQTCLTTFINTVYFKLSMVLQ